MHTAKAKMCTVDGCGRQTHGKAYCSTHLKAGKRPLVVLSKEVRAFMRSDCCGVVCIMGKRHDYGEQYCSECEAACCWKMPR